jgi:hypothetical protein
VNSDTTTSVVPLDGSPKSLREATIREALMTLNRKERRKLWAELRGRKVDRRNWRKR